MGNKELGALGEKQAREYLVKNKYKILTSNYSNKLGEIDIIAFKDGVTIFVEVKTRENTKYGLPREAVTTYKQNKIRQVALEYIVHNNLVDKPVRFDVIEILKNELTHIKNAF